MTASFAVNFARIYAFSFEGAIYSLPKPSIFLVHGSGLPIDLAIGNGGRTTTDMAGVVAREWEFSDNEADVLRLSWSTGNTKRGTSRCGLTPRRGRWSRSCSPRRSAAPTWPIAAARTWRVRQRSKSQRRQCERRQCERCQPQRRKSKRRKPSQPLSGGRAIGLGRARRLEHDASPAWRAPDHLARRRVLAPLAEAEAQIEQPRRVAVHDVERHRLAQRVGALKQLPHELRADSLSAEIRATRWSCRRCSGRRNRPPASSRCRLSPTQNHLAGAACNRDGTSDVSGPVPLADLRQMRSGPRRDKARGRKSSRASLAGRNRSPFSHGRCGRLSPPRSGPSPQHL